MCQGYYRHSEGYTPDWPGMAEFAESWARDKRFEPDMDAAERKRKIKGWDVAVRRTLSA